VLSRDIAYCVLAKVKSGDDRATVEERATRLNAFITRTFIDSVLKDRHEGLLYYQVYIFTFHAVCVLEQKVKKRECHTLDIG